MSVYNRLYNSLPREGHSQRENFLTEAFADLMNRLERLFPKEARRFISDILLRDMAAKRSADPLVRRVEVARHLRWDTQSPIVLEDLSRKRPDITITIDGECALLVEVKIGAAFTKRIRHSPKEELVEEKERAEQESGQDTLYQLDDYGKWLSDHYSSAALVLLTHSKEAPPDFLSSDGDRRYWIQLRSVCHWRGLYNWLRDWANKNRGNTDAESLARDFLEFLGEEGISEMNEKDVELLNGFLSFSRRKNEHKIDEKIKDTMLVARQAMLRLVPWGAQFGAPKSAEWDSGAFWDWSYPYDSPTDLDLYVGWGFSDAENPDFSFGLGSHHRLQAFVCVQGNRALKNVRSDKYKSWRVVAEEDDVFWIRTRDAADFARSESGFTRAFVEWLLPIGKEGAEILAAAWKTVKARKA